MASVHFKAQIQIRGVNPYVLVSGELVKRIKAGWRKPLPVVIRINRQPGQPWHTNMMPEGNGDFYLYLHGAMRKASNTQVGDTVAIEVGFDPNYRGGPQLMPVWFASALSGQPEAKANWERLSPSRQKEILRYFTNLKSPEARIRNLERALHALSGNGAQFMGRSWRDGA